MLFNSLEYAFFLPLVFALYWLIGYAKMKDGLKLRLQNVLVVLASYVFYGWWDWRFLLLIVLTSFTSWGSGLLMRSSRAPKVWLIANILLNVGILAVCKYYDFFVTELGTMLHVTTDSLLLHIILPVGISFYTFQAISYSMDVYRKQIAPTTDIIAFFAFIAFFPQLVAGPIERASHLLPQFLTNRRFSYHQATDGLRQILWGLFQKIVVADTCAYYVDRVWDTYPEQNGSTLVLAAILFSFRIYGDFAGYSNIAIGSAKLFGIQLMRNFNTPYFSRNIAEFWRRWHMSLTTWFRDYVYIPLGGSREGQWRTITNTFIVFLLCGLWHGANWTYVVWGLYHVLLFIVLIGLHRTKRYKDEAVTWNHLPQIIGTFVLVTIGWIIFRAPTITDAAAYLMHICSASLWSFPSGGCDYSLWVSVLMIGLMLGLEWHYRDRDEVPLPHSKWMYYLLVGLIWWFATKNTTDFIYFQF